MKQATLKSLCVSPPLPMEGVDPLGRPWLSGFRKTPVEGSIFLRTENFDGDGQADLVNHGGRDKAVLAYSADHGEFWTDFLGATPPPGGFGENLYIAGQDESTVCVGDLFSIGTAQLQVCQPRQPCWKLARRWQRGDLPKMVVEKGWGGWYLRVIAQGEVTPGDAITLLERTCERWTIARANDVLYHRVTAREEVASLAECPALAASFRHQILKQLHD